ncbi:MAG: hypothetical protein Q8R05_06250 [Candidatus Omnitrophota bacterium]|nr:hypothetical protein [Candidatus Omnitrophota bacterium]
MKKRFLGVIILLSFFFFIFPFMCLAQKNAVSDKSSPVATKNPAALEWFQKGRNAFEGKGVPKDLPVAIICFSKAIDLDKEYKDAYFNRSTCYLMTGKLDEALVDINMVLAIDPAAAMAYVNRAGVFRAKGQMDKAISDYDYCISLTPGEKDYYIFRGSAYQEMSESDKAISDFSQAIAIDPQSAEAYYRRSHAYLWKYGFNGGEEYRVCLDRAIADYAQTVSMDPKNEADFYKGRMGLYYRYIKEIVALTKKIELEPGDMTAYAKRGGYYRKLYAYDKALADLDKASSISPHDANIHLERCRVLIDKVDGNNITPELDRAFKADSANAKQHMMQALVSYYKFFGSGGDEAKKNKKRAVEEIEKAVELDTKNAFAWSLRAVIRYRCSEDYENIAQATVDMDQAIAMGNNDPKLILNKALGFSYSFPSKKVSYVAADEYARAILADPSYAKAYYLRGLMYFSTSGSANTNAEEGLKQVQAALEDINQAIKLAPFMSDAYFQRIWIYSFLGATKEAVADAKKVINMHSSDHDKKAAKRYLESTKRSSNPGKGSRTFFPMWFGNFEID